MTKRTMKIDTSNTDSRCAYWMITSGAATPRAEQKGQDGQE